MISSETKRPYKLIPQQLQKWNFFYQPNVTCKHLKSFMERQIPWNPSKNLVPMANNMSRRQWLLFLMHSDSSSDCTCINFQSEFVGGSGFYSKECELSSLQCNAIKHQKATPVHVLASNITWILIYLLLNWNDTTQNERKISD